MNFYLMRQFRSCVFIVLLNIIVSCSFIADGKKVKGFVVTQDMIGGMKTDDMKQIFGCNYILYWILIKMVIRYGRYHIMM